jgi:dipeptidyl aminopeptidase/acylaminoacyl peptidase
LVTGPEDVWPLDWSADGRLLLVGTGNVSAQTTSALGVVPSNGSGPIQPVDTGTGEVTFARFSNDGRSVAYAATSGGESNVYITGVPGPPDGSDLEPARRIQVSSQGGKLPQWGPGDREIVYARGDGVIVSAPLAPGTMEPGPEKELFRVVLRPGMSSLDMSADGHTFAANTLVSEGAAPIVVVTNWKREIEKR